MSHRPQAAPAPDHAWSLPPARGCGGETHPPLSRRLGDSESKPRSRGRACPAASQAKPLLREARFHPHANSHRFHYVLPQAREPHQQLSPLRATAAEGYRTSPRSLGRGNNSPVVILEKLLIDGMGEGETGCHQPDNRDAQHSFC